MKRLSALLVLIATSIFFAFTLLPEKKVVWIDVGHGGQDVGASYKGITEKEINLKIAQELVKLNMNEGLKIVLNRTNDEFITLEERVAKMKSLSPDYIISLHSNWSQNLNFQGVELYYPIRIDDETTDNLALHFEQLLGADYAIRGVKAANFFVLKNAPCPAVMLEMGFLSNEIDRKALTSKSGQREMALCILKSLKTLP